MKKLIYKIPFFGKVIRDRNTLFLENKILIKENQDYLKKIDILNSKNQEKAIRKNYSNVILKILYKRKTNSSYQIRVGFLVNENQKWNCQSLYEELEKHPKFTPIILVSPMSHIHQENDLQENYNFFKKQGMRVQKAYDEKNKSYISLSNFKPDIVFYQQPWGLDDTQNVYEVSKIALCCYISYAFTSFDYESNYLPHFHGLLWKYYVETKYHLDQFLENYKCTNCVASGYPKLDYFLNKNKTTVKSIWKITKIKNPKIKRIIYAPHHSINPTPLALSTFLENGETMLNLAKNTLNTEWIFKPHPNLKFNFVNTFPEKTKWFENYCKEWQTQKNTQVYNQGNYFDIFMTSDVLITDCGSFLTEYLLTGKPVIHLRTKKQNFPFNSIVKKIISSYYQVYSKNDLNRMFENVVIKNKDPLKKKRVAMINELNIDRQVTSASKIISDVEDGLLIN